MKTKEELKKEKIRRITILGLIVALVVTLAVNAKNFYNAYIIYDYDNYLTKLYEKKQENGVQALKEINSNFYCYIDIEDIDLHLPIVKTTSTEDEEYYLEHDFKDRNNPVGVPYNLFGGEIESTHNTTIIGHSAFVHTLFSSTKNQSLFSKLNNYMNYNSLYTYKITLETLDKIYEYKVASVLLTHKDKLDMDIYSATNFASQTAFNNYYNKIKSNSKISGLEEATFGDKFITLYTCYSNLDYRVMVIAKQVNVIEK